MHTHFFVHSQILFAYRIVIGSDLSWSDPNSIRQDYRIIGSDRIWADPIRSDPLPPLADDDESLCVHKKINDYLQDVS